MLKLIIASGLMVFSVTPGKNLDSTFNLAAISLIFAIY